VCFHILCHHLQPGPKGADAKVMGLATLLLGGHFRCGFLASNQAEIAIRPPFRGDRRRYHAGARPHRRLSLAAQSLPALPEQPIRGSPSLRLLVREDQTKARGSPMAVNRTSTLHSREPARNTGTREIQARIRRNGEETCRTFRGLTVRTVLRRPRVSTSGQAVKQGCKADWVKGGLDDRILAG